MKLIQIVLLTIVTITFILVRQKRSYLSRTLTRLGFLSITAGSVVGIIFPVLTQDLAEALGVGRGADLLIYINVVATLSAVLMIFVKIKQIENREVIIVREIALGNVQILGED